MQERHDGKSEIKIVKLLSDVNTRMEIAKMLNKTIKKESLNIVKIIKRKTTDFKNVPKEIWEILTG